jgi:hypothetical protein
MNRQANDSYDHEVNDSYRWQMANALDFLKSNPKKLCVDAIRMNNIILTINIKSWSEKMKTVETFRFFSHYWLFVPLSHKVRIVNLFSKFDF